jgi:hypothetical protein
MLSSSSLPPLVGLQQLSQSAAPSSVDLGGGTSAGSKRKYSPPLNDTYDLQSSRGTLRAKLEPSPPTLPSSSSAAASLLSAMPTPTVPTIAAIGSHAQIRRYKHKVRR